MDLLLRGSMTCVELPKLQRKRPVSGRERLRWLPEGSVRARTSALSRQLRRSSPAEQQVLSNEGHVVAALESADANVLNAQSEPETDLGKYALSRTHSIATNAVSKAEGCEAGPFGVRV